MSAPSVLAKNLRTIGYGVLTTLQAIGRAWIALVRSPYQRAALAGICTALPLSVGIAAYTLNPDDEEYLARANQQMIETALPVPAIAERITEVATRRVVVTHTTVIRRNDTLGSIFSRLNIDDKNALKFVRQQSLASALSTPREGVYVQAKVSQDKKLQSMKIFLEARGRDQDDKMVTITRLGEKLTIKATPFAYDTRQAMAGGIVKTTLWEAAQDAGLPDNVIAQISQAFERKFKDGFALSAGDEFRLIYERKFLEGDFVRTGKILALALTHEGQTIETFWADDGTADGGFYGLDGETTQMAFIRVPVDGARVTSRFMPMRRHPVTGVLRPHLGTDFGSAKGNKIYAAADGTITRRRFDHDGYGHYLVITHDSERTSLYAHMSKIADGMKVGKKVKKGDVIGYVGATGLATGPHLHYELRVNNRQVNPLKVKFPDKDRLTNEELETLLAQAQPLTTRLALINRIQSVKPQEKAEAIAQAATDKNPSTQSKKK